MKTVVMSLAVVLALVLVAPAMSASRDPRVPALQKQVKALRGEVASLSSQVGSLSSQVTSLSATVNSVKGVITRDEDINTCLFIHQGHFNNAVVNVFAAMLGNPQVADTTPSDNGACARVGLTPPARRVANSSPFASVTYWDAVVAQDIR